MTIEENIRNVEYVEFRIKVPKYKCIDKSFTTTPEYLQQQALLQMKEELSSLKQENEKKDKKIDNVKEIVITYKNWLQDSDFVDRKRVDKVNDDILSKLEE